jgi:hypothetical protein
VDFLVILAVLVALVLFVSAPLRAVRVPGPRRATPEVGDLEAAREAKYREIRDADLDHRTGKLSDEDYEAVDTQLRGEAIEIIHALDTIDEQ